MALERNPLARSDNLIVEELGDELLIYDLDADRAHSLSADAARVWRRCDGRTSADDLVRELEVDSATVSRALDELEGCALLVGTAVDGSTRRELGVRLVKASAAVAAAPLIVSVAAPTPAMAATPAFCGQFTNNDCGEGNGCKSSVGCCCCVPACGTSPHCPNCSGFPTGSKYCVPTGDVALCRSLCGDTNPNNNEPHLECAG